MLINLFISALWTTPSDSIGLTALATWILGCIAFVFVALLFYVVNVILINIFVTTYIFILTSQVILIKTYRISSYIITYIIKVILIKMKRAGKRADAKVSSFGDEKRKAKRKAPLDLDPLFFIIHLVTFALFVITYFFAYLA